MSIDTDIDAVTVEVTGTRPLVVLFADVSGSTRLYEEHGDDRARAAIGTCIEVLTTITERYAGRVVKTIGDEVMCVFAEPSRGLMASSDMQAAVRAASEDGRFVTGTLRIKVGLHYGRAFEDASDVVGAAATIAQGIIKLAKADQILTSGPTLDAAPATMRSGTRHFDTLPVEGHAGVLEIFEIIWEVTDATREGDASPIATRAADTALVLRYRGEECRLDADRPRAVLGRVEGNDLVVESDLASRTHAEIELRGGRFRIADNSANGTVVVRSDGRTTVLRREGHALAGEGRICLGGSPEDNPDGVVEYAVE